MKEKSYLVIQSWMRDDLKLSGNELIAYAVIYGFSQDGESKFIGSRQYIADWCGCSVRQVQNILNSLVERGLITKYEEFKNNIKYCSYAVNFTSGEKISPPSEKTALNNLEDSIGNKSLSKDKDININEDFQSHMYSKDDFLGSCKRTAKKPKQQRKTLYQKCYDACCTFTDNAITLHMLDTYLQLRLKMKDKPIYGVAQWDSLLDKLYQIAGTDSLNQQRVIKQSIENGWASFYEVQTGKSKRNKLTQEEGLKCERPTETVEERKARGVQAY